MSQGVEVAVLFLTPVCDMACPYCGSETTFKAFEAGQARSLLGELAAEGFRSVVFGGGEPFCWPHGLRALAKTAQGFGLETQVGSNLNLLPPDAPQWEEVDRWVLPLESDRAERHDALRPGPGSHHARVQAALEAFRQASRSVTVSSVARKGGLEDLQGVARSLQAWVQKGLKLHAWHLYRFQAMGRHGRDHAGRFALDDAGWGALSAQLRQDFPGLPLLLRPDMLHSKKVAFFWSAGQAVWQQGPGLQFKLHKSSGPLTLSAPV